LKHSTIFVLPNRRERKFGSSLETPAEIAQLVERNLAKVEVASSNLVFRSKSRYIRLFFCNKREPRFASPGGGIGRHEGLKIPWPCGRAGSSPASGTVQSEEQSESGVPRFVFLRSHSHNCSVFIALVLILALCFFALVLFFTLYIQG
jgi:hypothetical protein